MLPGIFAGMKAFKIILIVLAVLLVLLVGGLQLFLTKGLTTALNTAVFPAVKSMYGLDLSISGASVNLFTGSAELDDFKMRNLKGYQEPWLLTLQRCKLDVDLFSLLKRDPLVIKLAEAEGVVLTVERNSDRQFNVKELADALKPVEAAEPGKTPPPEEVPPEPVPTEKPVEPIPIQLRRIAADGQLRLIDSKDNREYILDLRLTGSDLFTVPQPGQKSSLLVLRGALTHDKNSFVTDLNAIIEPLTDPKNPTFTLGGSIMEIDAGFLNDLLAKNDMEAGSFSVKPSITSNAGRLDGSKLDLTLNNLRIYNTDIGDTTLTLPVKGTLRKPVINLTSALQSLFSEQAVRIGKTVGLRELKKELGLDPDAKVSRDSLMSGLTNNVKEVGDSPALQELIEQIAPSGSSTNAPSATNKPVKKAAGDALIEQLEKNVKETEGNEAIKETLRGLFR
jgi:hypothetical protein